MPTSSAMVRVAAVQDAPVFLERDATVERACERIAAAGREGARLVAFPESFIPGYPDWVWPVSANKKAMLNDLYAEFLANAVDVPSAAVDRLCQAAKQAGCYVVMGVAERNVEASGASLYNSLIYISDAGTVLGVHRKLVPTGGERLVWAPGDGSTLEAYDTPFGKIGGLICWENYMPLARYAMYAWGVQIYVAATWDRGEPWLSTLRHIAKEGRMVVIGAGIAWHRDDIPDRYEFKKLYPADRAWINVGDSAIVDPNGAFLAGPLKEQKGILYADVDLPRLAGGKWQLDVAGHYGRPDVFELILHRTPRPVLRIDDDGRTTPVSASSAASRTTGRPPGEVLET